MKNVTDRNEIESESIRWCVTLFFLATISSFANGQKVFRVDYPSQADAMLYETKNKSEADILIYKVSYASQVNPDRGLWLDVKNQSESDWKIFWAKYKNQSSCVVYFVPYRSQATRNMCYLDSGSNR